MDRGGNPCLWETGRWQAATHGAYLKLTALAADAIGKGDRQLPSTGGRVTVWLPLCCVGFDPNSLFTKSHMLGQCVHWQECTNSANIALLKLWHFLKFFQPLKKCNPGHTFLPSFQWLGFCPSSPPACLRQAARTPASKGSSMSTSSVET